MGTCGVSCSKSCDVRFPSADCKAKCEAGCEGSCKVDSNLDCQLDCQAKGYARCEADVQGCWSLPEPGSALFCDGQYVDHGDNLRCMSTRCARLNAHVEGEQRRGRLRRRNLLGHGRSQGEQRLQQHAPGLPANVWALFALIGAMLAYVLRADARS
jgi:hypothetical protein